MPTTPFIRPITSPEGIMYIFPSSIEDKFVFSKFALLRIPEIGQLNDAETNDNFLQFNALGETPLIEGVNTNQNINLSESFQNYCLNLESLLTSKDAYNHETKRNVSERIFFKWLKEIGALRFRKATPFESSITNVKDLFVEEDEHDLNNINLPSNYKKVVRYIADIDVVNSVKHSKNAYTEIYVHTPTSVGNTPYVLFDSIEDDNYKPGMILTNIPDNPLNSEVLVGRNYFDTHPYGLSIKGFFDIDDRSVTQEIYNYQLSQWEQSYWHSPNQTTNSYFTDTSANFHAALTQKIRKTRNSTTVEYKRSTLDGITIDFTLNDYTLAAQNLNIKTLSQMADDAGSKSFEFNAVLIYYDVFDQNNPSDTATNLYGILFLNKVEESGINFKIPTLMKYRPDPINNTNGVSYAFKANLKFDTSIDNVFIEKSINDFSTFSLDLYTDVLTELKDLNRIYTENINEIINIKNELDELKALLIDSTTTDELDTRLTTVENSLNENQALFDNTETIMTLISRNYDEIQNIYNNKTSIAVSYNIDAVKSGNGISIDKSVPNRIGVVNTVQNYTLSTSPETNIITLTSISLNNYTNYLRHVNNGNRIVLNNDVEIIIDDSIIKWKKGQVYRIVFQDEIVPNTFSIKLLTNSNNDYIGVIDIFSDADFTGNTLFQYRPIFEIICINEDVQNLEFRTDRIR